MALHGAVHEEARVDSAVIPVGLLGDGVGGAAKEGPFAVIGGMEHTEMFVLDETECWCGVFKAILAWEVLRDVGVQVSDGGVGDVNGDARPVVGIPVDGEKKLAVCQWRAIGKLVSPAVPNGGASVREG